MDAIKQHIEDARAYRADPHIRLRQAQAKHGTPAAMARHLAKCLGQWADGTLPADTAGLRLLREEIETLAYWCAVR